MSIQEALKIEFERRTKEESLTRILQCLALLSEDEVWHKHNAVINSVGNLVLHLSGNIRQWVITTLGRQPDVRARSSEFSQDSRITKEALDTLISTTIDEAVEVVHAMKEEDFLNTFEVQCFKDNGVAIIVHVIEHLSYHTGQITYLTKLMKEVDTAYYGGMELD